MIGSIFSYDLSDKKVPIRWDCVDITIIIDPLTVSYYLRKRVYHFISKNHLTCSASKFSSASELYTFKQEIFGACW